MNLSQEQLDKMYERVEHYCADIVGCQGCRITEPCQECSGVFLGNKESLSEAYKIICGYENEETDNVNHPAHYTVGGIECIDAISASMTHEAYCGFLKGNIEKYLWRYEHKNGIEDLKKAKVYLDWLIEEVENKNKEENT